MTSNGDNIKNIKVSLPTVISVITKVFYAFLFITTAVVSHKIWRSDIDSQLLDIQNKLDIISRIESDISITRQDIIVTSVNIQIINDSVDKLREALDGEKDSYISYTVQAGDSWYSIAREYGISPFTLVSLNPRIGDNLHPGMIIKVPVDDVD